MLMATKFFEEFMEKLTALAKGGKCLDHEKLAATLSKAASVGAMSTTRT